MNNIEYRKYSKKRMIEILHREGIASVVTSLGDRYIIRKADIADFLIIEAYRTDKKEEIKFYFPQIEVPVLITLGTFFKSVNPILKGEIIGRVSFLERFQIKPRPVKIFDLKEFDKFNDIELGNEKRRIKDFKKFYEKYL